MGAWFEMDRFAGLVIGFCTFLIIGIFHPLVVKGEYWFGVRVGWGFLLLGVVTAVASLSVDSLIVSVLLGVTAFSSFWSILEVFQQRKRVEKGWFPENPKRRRDHSFHKSKKVQL